MSQTVTLVSGRQTIQLNTSRAAATELIIDAALTTSGPDDLTARRLARYNTNSGDIVSNLPPASSVRKNTVIAVKNEVGGNDVDVTPDGLDTIDSVAALLAIGPSVGTEFYSDGVSNWTAL